MLESSGIRSCTDTVMVQANLPSSKAQTPHRISLSRIQTILAAVDERRQELGLTRHSEHLTTLQGNTSGCSLAEFEAFPNSFGGPQSMLKILKLK